MTPNTSYTRRPKRASVVGKRCAVFETALKIEQVRLSVILR